MRSTKTAQKALLDLVIVFCTGILVYVSGRILLGPDPVAVQATAWCTNMAMIGVVLVISKIRNTSISAMGVGRLPDSVNGWGRFAVKVLLTLVVTVFAFAAGSVVMANITGIPEQADLTGYDFLAGNLPAFLLVITGVLVASSFGEEFIYRGFLIGRLRSLFGGGKRAEYAAILISSIVFGLIHWEWGPMGIIQTMFMGAALALMWRRFDYDLWIVVAAHGIMDLILMTQLYF